MAYINSNSCARHSSCLGDVPVCTYEAPSGRTPSIGREKLHGAVGYLQIEWMRWTASIRQLRVCMFQEQNVFDMGMRILCPMGNRFRRPTLAAPGPEVCSPRPTVVSVVRDMSPGRTDELAPWRRRRTYASQRIWDGGRCTGSSACVRTVSAPPRGSRPRGEGEAARSGELSAQRPQSDDYGRCCQRE